MQTVVALDPRIQRTREALMRATTQLVLGQGYEAASIAAIVERAGVGRSTFYEHFRSKDDIIGTCMSGLFAVIADTVSLDEAPPRLGNVIAHLWENRRVADAIFRGPTRAILARVLGQMIEERLKAMAVRARGRRPTMPVALAAVQSAEAQLALIDAWLHGRASCPAESLAEALHATSRASTVALFDGSRSRSEI